MGARKYSLFAFILHPRRCEICFVRFTIFENTSEDAFVKNKVAEMYQTEFQRSIQTAVQLIQFVVVRVIFHEFPDII